MAVYLSLLGISLMIANTLTLLEQALTSWSCFDIEQRFVQFSVFWHFNSYSCLSQQIQMRHLPTFAVAASFDCSVAPSCTD